MLTVAQGAVFVLRSSFQSRDGSRLIDGPIRLGLDDVVHCGYSVKEKFSEQIDHCKSEQISFSLVN